MSRYGYKSDTLIASAIDTNKDMKRPTNSWMVYQYEFAIFISKSYHITSLLVLNGISKRIRHILTEAQIKTDENDKEHHTNCYYCRFYHDIGSNMYNDNLLLPPVGSYPSVVIIVFVMISMICAIWKRRRRHWLIKILCKHTSRNDITPLSTH